MVKTSKYDGDENMHVNKKKFQRSIPRNKDALAAKRTCLKRVSTACASSKRVEEVLAADSAAFNNRGECEREEVGVYESRKSHEMPKRKQHSASHVTGHATRTHRRTS